MDIRKLTKTNGGRGTYVPTNPNEYKKGGCCQVEVASSQMESEVDAL